MAQVGRISGPLLEANLVRNGVDLAFRNDLDTTQLLYLNVNDGKISINRDAQPSYELQTVGTTRTTDLIADYANLSNFTINNSTISPVVGDINLNAAEAIILPALDNSTLFIDGNFISATVSNANIDIIPNGSGETNIVSDLNVYGDFYSSGDITLDGSITFGSDNADVVDFNADVDSNIIPDESNTYSIGSITKRWNTLYTNLLNGQAISTSSLTIGLIDFNKSQGNIIYVAQNGTDTNRGDHIFAPVASIRRALELADASVSGPVVIYVNPGDYEEETPLVVPSNVSIIGTDIRNVNVFPTSYTLSEDVFHLNGETTIANLTVKNFYYNDNKGYAFRFAPNAIISSRSPYIQNVTVITQGSNTSVDDPRGFDSGDAGRGAYIDGAELNSASIDASMLFHSCTFITPGVDAITMTNGVRVEWLNSFTYFANRGLYAFNNSTGRVSNDGSTVNYGAEVRSIGSANVYGNYGAVADGADCLMYLIQHNFAYVGSGKDVSNDSSLAIQANEVVEENSGQIHYVTTDHTGAFRVGDNFFIDFETGSTSVDLSSLTADSLTGLVINTGADRTFVTGEKVETGNIRFSGNTVESLAGDINLDTATGEINLNDNTNVSGSVDITGNLTFGGNLNLLGNQTSDTLTFNVDFDQDFIPNQTLTYNLGSVNKNWLNSYLSEINLNDIKIYDNVIETVTSNADLELRANGTGTVNIISNTVISNDLFSLGTFISEGSSIINGSFEQTGDVTALQLASTIGNVSVGGDLSVDQQAVFEEITVDDNVIFTNSSNTDLELRANGTGDIKLYNLLETDNALLNTANVTENYTVDTDITYNVATISSIYIENNSITTTISNANLELRAPSSSTFSGGNSTDISSLILDGGTSTTSIFESIFDGEDAVINFGETEPKIIVRNNFKADQSLTVNGLTQINNTSVVGNIVHTGQRQLEGNYLLQGNFEVDNITIKDNIISTINSNSDLDLRASGTGILSILDNDLQIDNDLLVSSDTNTNDITASGLITQAGEREQVGNYNQLGNLTINGVLSTDRVIQFENIKINDNTIITTESNSDLELRAAGTGKVSISKNNVQINNNLFVSSIVAGNVNIDADLVLNEIVIPPSIIEIDDNFITTKESNADLELRASDIVVSSIVLSAFGGNGGASPAHSSYGCAGGGAGGYSGNGGRGGTGSTNLGTAGTGGAGGGGYVGNNSLGPGAGGGVGLLGEGASGGSGGFSNPGGQGGSGGTRGGAGATGVGGLFGGGGGSNPVGITSGGGGGLRYVNDIPVTPGDTYTLTIGAGGTAAANVGAGGGGGMRIIWGEGRAYPSTNTADVSDQQVVYDTPGVYEWTVPEGVTSICVVCVGGGASGWGGTDGGNTSFDTIFFAEGGKTPLTSQGVGSGGGGSSEAVITIGGATGDSNRVSIPNNDVQINNNLTVAGNTSLQDTSITGSLLHTGSRTQTGNANIDGTLTITGLSTFNSQVQFENININDNLITTTASNSDLELQAAGTGKVKFKSLQIDNNLSVNNIVANDIIVDADIVLNEIDIPPSIIEIDDNFITTRISNADLDLRANGIGQIIFDNNVVLNQQLLINENFNTNTLTVNGTLTQNGNRIQQGNFLLNGLLSVNGLVHFNSDVEFEDILISGNTVTTTSSNSSLELSTNGNGNILISSNDVEILQDIFVGQLTSKNINIDNSFALDSLESSSDIQIFDNVITTTNSNSDLELRANGTGSVQLQLLTFDGNTIQTPASNISFSAATVIIDATGALKIPVGDTDLTEQGTIKFNSLSGFFEGKNTETITLTGLYSTDRKTNLLAHPTNNTINLTVNNALVGTVAATGLTIHEIQVDDVTLKLNEISTNALNQNLELTAPGTGKIVIDDILITDNIIENSSSGLLSIANTGFGKVKFTGNALAIPSGTTEERPANPPIGDTRWNTTTSILETWDGGQYITAAGISSAISEAEFNDLLFEYTLIFG